MLYFSEIGQKMPKKVSTNFNGMGFQKLQKTIVYWLYSPEKNQAYIFLNAEVHLRPEYFLQTDFGTGKNIKWY